MQMRRKIGYAMGDMGISISYFAVGFFFMYYLTDILGMSPYLAGLAFFVGKLWDGINDPLMGIISDRTRTRFGRKRVYILFGALPLALSFILLWLIPINAPEWLQFALAVASLTLYGTTYTVVVVPYMSLVPVMSNDYNERTQITGVRAVLSTIGTILGGGAAMILSSFSDEVLGLQTIAIAFGAFTLVSLLIAARSVKGVEDKPEAASAIIEFGLSRYLALIKERNVLNLMVVKILGAIATGTLTAALPYFAAHVIGDQGKSTIGLAIYVSVSAIAIPIWNKLAQKFEKRRLLLIGNVASALVLLAIGFLVQTGSVLPFYLGCIPLGLAMSAYLLIPYSLVPDLVDTYEYNTGERHESVFFGLWITVHQLGIAVAGLILGSVLGSFGYNGEAVVQTESAVLAVRVAFGVTPGLFFVLAALVLQKYGVTRQVYQQVRAELESRAARAAVGSTIGAQP
jgi:GPH family glycoside/pentoside/hexuronide:cation symporter